MNSVKNVCRVGQMSIRNLRQMSTGKKTIVEIEQEREKDLPKDLHPMFYKLKADQKLYQKPDGIPIHFKRGARDKILYYITLSLVGVGLVGCAEFVYSLP
ncbi:uncharacterized protein LOC116338703 [Contarinia nasturtii]|uniref:uncharacterized protein LOC116338703 n=1 Tax=Contarinia nasturtii TaxID=265458 RepID=UPI0012D3AC1E|nr:uncharacterized protein LOC116338703 [Contarinia nasturtii]